MSGNGYFWILFAKWLNFQEKWNCELQDDMFRCIFRFKITICSQIFLLSHILVIISHFQPFLGFLAEFLEIFQKYQWIVGCIISEVIFYAQSKFWLFSAIFRPFGWFLGNISKLSLTNQLDPLLCNFSCWIKNLTSDF